MFQKVLLSIILFCAISIVAFFLIIKVIDFNEYKPRIQKAIKDNTGYELIIKGDITLSLSPVGVRIFDIEVRNPQYKSETSFATLGSFDVALEIAPLLKKEIKIKHVSFEKLNVMIEKNKDGRFNFDLVSPKPKSDKKPKEHNTTLEQDDDFPLVNIKKIKFSEANLSYLDGETNTTSKAEKINLSVHDIHFDAMKHNKLQGLFLKGDAQIEKLSHGAKFISDISMNLEMKDAIVAMENLKYILFDSTLQGSGKLDLSGKITKISLKHKVAELKLQPFSKALFGKELLDGQASGELKLACSLGDIQTIKSTLGGFIVLAGENVTLRGYDIDKIASALSDSTSFNLANLLLGVSGNFEGNSSVLKSVMAKVDIDYSEAKLTDVAFSSAKHRIALKGALQIIEEKFLDVKVALLDTKGCARFEQTIVGTFQKPKLKVDETTINTIANAALSLLGKSKNTQQEEAKRDENCVPFYEGTIKHPEMK